ncbi:MAG TPA: RNA methyltransferase [Candidatus Bathyarchaeia archaeon]|nr:RNA methyltransferase [Candidatus Bathyarchaeia archaeon]
MTKKTIGELLYGIHPAIEVLKAKKRKVISFYTTKPEPKGWTEIKKYWPSYHIPIQYVTREILSRMAGTADHQGVVAWVEPYGFRKKMFDAQKAPFIVIFDGIQDPRNVGAIIRSAYCAGVNGIMMTQKHASPLNATAVKASAGLSEHMEIMLVPSALWAVQELHKLGYEIVLAAFGGENALSYPYKAPLCLVVGSEGSGISKALYSYGKQVTIPQRSPEISYNVSVAAGILMVTAAVKINTL